MSCPENRRRRDRALRVGMKRIPLKRLEGSELQDAWMAAGTVEGDRLVMTDENYRSVWIKATGADPAPPAMIRSFWGSVARWAASGFPVSTAGEFQRRLDACIACDKWDKEGFGGSGRCSVCGCSTQAKLRIATEECPIGKWGSAGG